MYLEVWGVQGTRRRKDTKKGEASVKKRVRGEENLEIYGRLREELGMKTCLYGSMDYAKTLKLQFRVGDPDLSERRKRYTSNREEEDAQMCPCGKDRE